MNNRKKCTHCLKNKDASKDFYLCSGRIRGECKACTINKNVKYQKKVGAWKVKFKDDATRHEYMREYYKNNKEKFARYRAEFKLRNPEYYKNYLRMRKEK